MAGLSEIPAPGWERRSACWHRPDRRPVMFQSWKRLLFLHWRMPAELIQEVLPQGLTVDTHGGSAWVGLVPFEMRGIRPRGLPAVPYLSDFLELNLRTYVFDKYGLPGVWFLSLSANRKIAVDVARRWFGLPYYWSRMSRLTDAAGWIEDRCRRFNDPRRRVFETAFRPQGTPTEAVPGTLDDFLIERYFLFSDQGGRGLASGQVYHPRYRIQPVELRSCVPCVFEIDGLPSPMTPPDHVAYSPGVDVEIYGLQAVRAEGTVSARRQGIPTDT